MRAPLCVLHPVGLGCGGRFFFFFFVSGITQVGKYKTKLETQGWEYEMQVSFLEIYNEQIRDLLRDEGSKVRLEVDRTPDIQNGKRKAGNAFSLSQGSS